MNSHMRRAGTLAVRAFSLALVVWVLSDSSVVADDNGYVAPIQGPGVQVVPNQGQVVQVVPYQGPVFQVDPNQGVTYQAVPPSPVDHGNASAGTLGYGPPGLFPGFQGFGLGYHLGYGYGGAALGVGAEGGYPFYGGPGYPHAAPTLRRIGGITPFAFYGGPGHPTPDHPNYFGGVGPLVPDKPVITIATETGAPVEATDYGLFTGGVSDPEALFAPFTARAAAGAATMESGPAYPTTTPPVPAPTTPPPGASLPIKPPATGGASNLSTVGRSLGLEEEPVVDANGARGVKISHVHAGAAAEKAGLHVGDLIYSSNGYLTQGRGNLAWIIAHAAPNKVLTMRVRTTSDSKEHTITAQLR